VVLSLLLAETAALQHIGSLDKKR